MGFNQLPKWALTNCSSGLKTILLGANALCDRSAKPKTRPASPTSFGYQTDPIQVESAKTEQVRVYVAQSQCSESDADGEIGAPGLFGVAGGTNRSR